MSLIVHPEVKALGICNPVACIVKNVKVNMDYSSRLDDAINTLMDKVKENTPSFTNTNQAKGFKEFFYRMGYPKQIPAGERLFNSFASKGFKRIDNIVDACNIVGMENVAGLGLHNAENFHEMPLLHIWRALGTEKIVPSFKTKEEKIKKNDLVYGQINDEQKHVIAWLGKQDRDSDHWKVVADTTSLLFVVLGNEHTTLEHNQGICERFFQLIKLTCEEAEYQMLSTEHMNQL